MYLAYSEDGLGFRLRLNWICSNSRKKTDLTQKFHIVKQSLFRKELFFWIFPFVYNNVYDWFLITYSFEMARGIFSLAGISNNKLRCKFQNLMSYTFFNVHNMFTSGTIVNK